VKKQSKDTEGKRRAAKIQLENYTKKKNLVNVGGVWQVAQEPQKGFKKYLKASDIPNYDKIKVRDNPLDSIVKKFEEQGFTPQEAFLAFDDDCDEVLTIEEIKDGCAFYEIKLLDTEWKMLIDSIDKNADGVLTIDEWEEVLQPRLDA